MKEKKEELWVYLIRIILCTVPIYLLAIIFRCASEIEDIITDPEWFRRK